MHDGHVSVCLSDNFLNSEVKQTIYLFIYLFCFFFLREEKAFIVTANGLIPDSSYGSVCIRCVLTFISCWSRDGKSQPT